MSSRAGRSGGGNVLAKSKSRAAVSARVTALEKAKLISNSSSSWLRPTDGVWLDELLEPWFMHQTDACSFSPLLSHNTILSLPHLYTVAHTTKMQLPCLVARSCNLLLTISGSQLAAHRISACRSAARNPAWRLICAQSASTSQYFSIDLLH